VPASVGSDDMTERCVRAVLRIKRGEIVAGQDPLTPPNLLWFHPAPATHPSPSVGRLTLARPTYELEVLRFAVTGHQQ
jgi:hypothetical protein